MTPSPTNHVENHIKCIFFLTSFIKTKNKYQSTTAVLGPFGVLATRSCCAAAAVGRSGAAALADGKADGRAGVVEEVRANASVSAPPPLHHGGETAVSIRPWKCVERGER